MNNRKQIKLNRIFRDGLAVCIAVDHGFMSDPTENIRKIKTIIQQVTDGGVDGILISYGQALMLKDIFTHKDSPALLLRVDWMNALRLGKANTSNAIPCASLKHTMIISVQDAIKLGADAITVYYVIGYDEKIEREQMNHCALLAEQCFRYGLPLVIEPMIIGGKVNGSYDAEMLIDAARIAQELGADLLKIPYTGDMGTFKELCEGIDIPLLVLGGAKSKREEDGYEIIHEALQAGASGVVFGRKVTTSKNPKKFVENIVDLVHHKKPINEILHKNSGKNFRILYQKEKCTGCRICVNICKSYWGKSRINIKKEEFNQEITHCTKCGICQRVCPQNAIKISDHILVNEDCNLCGQCIDVCPNHILKIIKGQLIFCSYCEGQAFCECVEWCPEGALVKEVIR